MYSQQINKKLYQKVSYSSVLKKRFIFHVDLDAFFASVEKVLNPKLKNKAVIVGSVNNRGVVACPSYEARALGIKTAMPIYQARQIAPHAVFVEGNFTYYKTFSEKFFDLLFQYTDKIEPRSLDEAYIDMSHLAKNTRQAFDLAHELQNTIKEKLQLSASIGIARNKVCAKVASELRKPGGITLVQPNQEKAFLASLPIENLPGIGKRTKEALNNLGVYQIRQLADIPEKIVIETFGKSGLMLSEFANGIDWREVEKPEESKSVSKSETLFHDTCDANILKEKLYMLLENCAFTLRKQKRHCDTITVTVRFSDFRTIHRQKKILVATNLETELWPITEKLIQTMASKKKMIRMLGVSLSNLTKKSHQTNIFDYPFSKLKNIQQAVDKIRLQFGFQTIQSGKIFHVRKPGTYQKNNYYTYATK